jgi:hypothetical protein
MTVKLSLRLSLVLLCLTLAAGWACAATAPTLAITSPEEGFTVASRTVAVEAAFEAEAGTKVARVELAVDGTTIEARTLEPPVENGQVSFTWMARDYAAGSHHLTVRAISDDGVVSAQAITVELRGTLEKSDNGVRIIAPAAGQTVSGQVEVMVEADNPTLARYVIFLVDDVLKAVSNVQPFLYKWDTTRYLNGSHYLKVKVFAAGEWEAVSEPVAVIVDNPSGATAMRTPALQATPVAPAPVAPPVRTADTTLPPAVLSDSAVAAYPTAALPAPELALPGSVPYVNEAGELVTPVPATLPPAVVTPAEMPSTLAASSDTLVSDNKKVAPVEIALLPADLTTPAVSMTQPEAASLPPAEISTELTEVTPVASASDLQTVLPKPVAAPSVEVAMLPPKPAAARPAPKVATAPEPVALGGTRVAALQFNGQTLALDTPAMITRGRAIVPFRTIVEQAGGKVAWDSAKRTARAISAQGRQLAVIIGSDQASVDGNTVAMAVAAQLRDNRTVVPARFLGDALDLALQYEDGVIHLAQSK